MNMQRHKTIYQSLVPGFLKKNKKGAAVVGNDLNNGSNQPIGSPKSTAFDIRDKQASSILAQGSWIVQETAKVKWVFTQNSLSFVTEYLNGRNETYSVALEDILSLRLIENSSLYLIFKNVIKKSICVCLIPSFGTSTQLATINSAWNTCSISSIRGVDSEDLYDVLWSGLGNKGPEMFVYAFNRKTISFCRLHGKPKNVRFAYVSDLLFDNDPLDMSMGSLTIKYVDFASYNSCEIEENSLEISRFGSEKDFEELCLLWRQELQLQMIEDAFGNSNSPESLLSAFARERRQASNFNQKQSIENLSISSSSNIENLVKPRHNRPPVASMSTLRRANSMRHIYRPRDIPTPSSTPTSELSVIMEKLTNMHVLAETITEVEEEPVSKASQTVGDDFQMDIDQKPPTPENPPQDMKGEEEDEEAPKLIRQRSYTDPWESVKQSMHDLQLSVEETDLIKRRKTEKLDRSKLPMRRAGRKINALKPNMPDTYVATYGYPDAGKGEMTLQKHDRVRVVKKDKSGWWYGLKLVYKQDGLDMRWVVTEEGWVPSNYLQPSATKIAA